MNRREFIKLGMATLASAWCVRNSDDAQVIAKEFVEQEIKTEKSCYDCGKMTCSVDCSDLWNRPYFAGPGLPLVKKEWVEYGCENCHRYFCGPDCSHYQGDSLYFVALPIWK